MTKLSPEAQAVLDAYENTIGYRQGFAAVIRELADQVAPREDELIDDCWYEKRNPVREKLFTIADELEAL